MTYPGQSVWENIDLGREYRLDFTVKILGKQIRPARLIKSKYTDLNLREFILYAKWKWQVSLNAET